MPLKGVLTCRHRSKHSFGDVLHDYKASSEVLTRCHFIAPGIADFLFPKAVPNEKHIPTCVPQCYDVEKILILFILDTSKISTLANSDDSDVSATDTTGIFGQILNYINSLVLK